jgi:hypothetical protein
VIRRRGALLLLVLGTAQGSLVGQQPTFRAVGEVVTVSVSVRDGNRPVAGLTATDFELLDSGAVQEISALTEESLPIDVTLLLDTSSSVQGQMLERLKTGVLDVSKLLGPDDRFRLIEVRQHVREAFSFRAGGSPPTLDGLLAVGATSLHDGLAAAMIHANVPDRRHVIVLLTDGRDTASIMNADATVKLAGLTDSVVHAVVPIEGDRFSGGRGPGDLPVLREITSRTGGEIFVIALNDSLSAAFTRVIADFRASYLLRYSPRGVPHEGWHDIGVRVLKSRKYEVRARRGYTRSPRLPITDSPTARHP